MPFPIPSGLPCALGLGTPGFSSLLWNGVTKPPAPLPVLVASSGCSSRSYAGGSYSSGGVGVIHNLLFLFKPPPLELAPVVVGSGGRGALRDGRRGPHWHRALQQTSLCPAPRVAAPARGKPGPLHWPGAPSFAPRHSRAVG